AAIGDYLYVTTSAAETQGIFVVDATSGRLANQLTLPVALPGGIDPSALAAGGGELFLLSGDHARIHVLSAEDGSYLRNIPLTAGGVNPGGGLARNPDAGTLWISDDDTGTLVEIDRTTGAALGSLGSALYKVRGITVSADMVVVATADGSVRRFL